MKINQFIKQWGMVVMIFIGASMGTPDPVGAQTKADRSLEIVGHFARFPLKLSPSPQFLQQAQAQNWLQLFDNNFCWSGVFVLSDSRQEACQTTDDNVDLQIKLDLLKNQQVELEFKVVNPKGDLLYRRQLPLLKQQLDESQVIDTINELTLKMTGTPGILGSTIAFAFKQPQHHSVIARVDTHGKRIESISHNQGISLLPRWHPKGNAIVYTILNRFGSTVIFDDFSGNPIPLAKYKGVNSGGSWSKDGEQLVITLSKEGNADLYELQMEGLTLKQLTIHPAIETSPALSPDHQYLVFVSDRSGTEQIYIKNLTKETVFRLTFDGLRNSSPVWSPDGKWIAFTKNILDQDQIYLMLPFGDEAQPLTHEAFNSEQPAWAPNGTQIIFSSNRTGDYKLYTMFIDGSGVRRVTNTPKGFQEHSPTWSYRQFK
ncbi:hypothetical protein WDW89_25085 [Deltaproteobacteria bacterium TL4]